MDPKNIASTVRNLMNNPMGSVMLESFMEKVDMQTDGGQIMQVSILLFGLTLKIIIGRHIL